MEEFHLSIGNPENRHEIREFLMRHFLVEETMNAATRITEAEFSPFAEDIFDTSLQTPFSIICRHGIEINAEGIEIDAEKAFKSLQGHKNEFCPFHGFQLKIFTENGNIVGVALSSIRRRNDVLHENPFGRGIRPEIAAIASICDEMHKNLWDLLDPEINTVLELDILNVALPYQRRGIASKMLEKRKSSELLQKYRIQGFICQASSCANQTLMKNRGYQELKDVPFTRYVDDKGIPLIRPLDETKSVKLFWKPLNSQ